MLWLCHLRGARRLLIKHGQIQMATFLLHAWSIDLHTGVQGKSRIFGKFYKVDPHSSASMDHLSFKHRRVFNCRLTRLLCLVLQWRCVVLFHLIWSADAFASSSPRSKKTLNQAWENPDWSILVICNIHWSKHWCPRTLKDFWPLLIWLELVLGRLHIPAELYEGSHHLWVA